jgi:hypothetical protein
MEALRALIYAAIVFAALGIISLIVAGIMRILYLIVHKNEKKAKVENTESTVESKGVS